MANRKDNPAASRLPCSHKTKGLLEEHKHVNETWDELLRRLALSIEPTSSWKQAREQLLRELQEQEA